MSVTVLFFGAVANDVGSRSKQIEIVRGKGSADLFESIVAEYPSLRRHKLLFAVNQEYVSGDAPLKEGDEIAIFTAVSGG